MLGSMAAFGQNIDQERMTRDIEIAENILSTLMRQEMTERGGFPFGSSIEGKYLEDYGVIFTIPNHVMRYVKGIDGQAIRISRVPEVRSGNTYTIRAHSVAEAKALAKEAEVKSIEAASTVKVINMDSLQERRKEKSIEVMKIFLADYGNLINQLKPSHKILITNRERQFEFFNNISERNELTLEAKVSDINAYKEGKITRDKMMENIKVTDKKVSDEKYTDLELLSSIFERLYRSDLSNTYYVQGRIPYDRLSDFGVIYKMKVVSSSMEGGNHMITTRNITGLTQAERDEIVKEMYPEFLEELKRNILNYGKTINSLKNSEMLLFHVELTKCQSCRIPKSIELSVKNEVLQQYGMGKLSEDKALEQISVQIGELQ